MSLQNSMSKYIYESADDITDAIISKSGKNFPDQVKNIVLFEAILFFAFLAFYYAYARNDKNETDNILDEFNAYFRSDLNFPLDFHKAMDERTQQYSALTNTQQFEVLAVTEAFYENIFKVLPNLSFPEDIGFDLFGAALPEASSKMVAMSNLLAVDFVEKASLNK